MVNTDRAWETVAQTDPYWGVLTSDEFLGAGLDASTEAKFFGSGQVHIDEMLDVLRSQVRPGFAPASSLDYGCGVGRLLLPLSALSERVVGVDISDSMLARARQHLAAAGRTNAELIHPDQLSSVLPVDFIHSTIVLQHINPKRGLPIVEQLVDVLAPDGCGALQFHLQGAGGTAMRLVRGALERSQTLNQLAVRVTRRPTRNALVLMHPYNLTSVLRILAARDITDVVIRTIARPDGFTEATVFFHKPA
jgi:SAM-dependent methyltransferase